MDDDFDTEWSMISFEPKTKKTGVEKSAPVSTPKTCPKCGRTLGRGGHRHVKACKGEDR